MLFVRQSTHDELRGRYSKLLWQWNSLVGRVNELDEEALLSGKKHRLEIEGLKKSPLSDEDLRKMIQLCHPDRHDGKPLAQEMTAKLNALRQKLKSLN